MTSIRLAAARDTALSVIGAVLFSAMIVAASAPAAASPAEGTAAAIVAHA